MTDEYLRLRAAHKAGCRIQAWTLNSGADTSRDGYWRTLKGDGPPMFSCPAHLYRVHPDDLGLLPTEPVADDCPECGSRNAEECGFYGCGSIARGSATRIRAGEYFSEHDLEGLGLGADWTLALVPVDGFKSRNTAPTEPSPDREDAERYRWLRRGLANNRLMPDSVAQAFADAISANDATLFDKAIDAALEGS